MIHIHIHAATITSINFTILSFKAKLKQDNIIQSLTLTSRIIFCSLSSWQNRRSWYSHCSPAQSHSRSHRSLARPCAHPWSSWHVWSHAQLFCHHGRNRIPWGRRSSPRVSPCPCHVPARPFRECLKWINQNLLDPLCSTFRWFPFLLDSNWGLVLAYPIQLLLPLLDYFCQRDQRSP